MRKQKGFTLIELLIVVAIIGIIAAIAIPSLLRARVSANESAAVGDVRTVLSAQAAFQSAAAGFYGPLTCLSTPTGCITGYPATAPTFIDANMANGTTKSGYGRTFDGNPGQGIPTNLTGVLDAFCYTATPATQNQTGVRGFGGDHSGRICADPAGAYICTATGLDATCAVIQ